MSSTPQQWASFTLGDISKLPGGKTPSKANLAYWQSGEFFWASPKDIKSTRISGTIDKVSRNALTEGGLNLFPVGSILFVVRSGILKHTFPVAIADVPVTVNQDLKVIEPCPFLHQNYLAFMLRAFSQTILNECTKAGTTVDSIEVPQLSEFTFPLPPLAEQKQIAAKLDELLAQVDTIKARLDAIPKILKRFRQSVLAAAGSGRLTEEWRESKGECSWSSATLIEICNPKRALTYGVIKLGDETSDGVICLRTSNVRWLQVDVDSVKKIAPEISNEYTRTILDGTEVLVNVRGTLGGVAAATPEMKGWNVSREVAVVPISSGIANSEFIAFLIASEEKQKWLTGVQKGVAYTGINIEDLRELPINLPSRAEQTEIVRRVEQLFAFADQIETRVQDATARVNHLTQSILAKAFRGELTADWRAQNPDLISGENSAEALLARIRAEREAASKPKKAKVIRHSRAGGNP